MGNGTVLWVHVIGSNEIEFGGIIKPGSRKREIAAGKRKCHV